MIMQKRRNFRMYLAAVLGATLTACCINMQTALADDREYIVKYKNSMPKLMSENDGMPFDVISCSELQSLIRTDALDWYEEDGYAELYDSVYYTEDKWDLKMIGADGAYEKGLLGQGVRVGVIDSGISSHPDIGNLVKGYNYIEDSYNPENTTDNIGHGTSVAGLIAGAGEGGYIGTAPEAEIVPLKCTDSKDNIRISTICRAIYGGIDDFDCDVLNMSLGSRQESNALKEAMEYAAEKNVIVISAAGNYGDTGAVYPAAYDTVIGVGAVSQSGNMYEKSNHNKGVYLTAPGVNVKSTANYGGYTEKTGTSFSTPLVTGAAAVLLSIDPTLTNAELMNILSQTAVDYGAEGYDEYYGYGLLNIADAANECLKRAPSADACSFIAADGTEYIQNNTDFYQIGTYYCAEYDNNVILLGTKAYDITLKPREIMELQASNADIYAHFFWRRGTMIPIAAAKKSR